MCVPLDLVTAQALGEGVAARHERRPRRIDTVAGLRFVHVVLRRTLPRRVSSTGLSTGAAFVARSLGTIYFEFVFLLLLD